MTVTIKDVAELAGVSAKTVSRVVNDEGELSPATRERVRAAIKQLGYRPNIVARNLVRRRTNTLAVVAWGIDLYGPSRVVLGIEQRADELGYSLLLNLRCTPEDSNPGAVLDGLAEKQVDGIVWAVPEVGHNRDWITPEKLRGLAPIVWLTMQPRPDLDVVAVDNRCGARKAARHLTEEGCRHIGIITGPSDWWEARERLAGWREALSQAGLAADAQLMVEGDWSAESGDRGLESLLTRLPILDGVVCCNDQMALGALGAVRRCGRKVPEDLALVGFDDIPESAHFWPPLTTVHQDLVRAGQIAVQELDRFIRARRQGELNVKIGARLLEPELVVRSSSERRKEK